MSTRSAFRRRHSPDESSAVAAVAAELAGIVHQKFEVRQIGGGATLPNGVMEFWLGKSPDPAPSAR